jgi:hypothetical protein
MKYYGLPLKIASFIQQESPDKQVEDDGYRDPKSNENINVVESIKLNLQLLLRTKLKSCRFDPELGYLGWSKDFENITNESKWEKDVKEDFRQKVIEYERRLIDVRIVIDLKRNNNKSSIQNHQFLVKVEAKLRLTSDPFLFEELMFFSPIRISASRF